MASSAGIRDREVFARMPAELGADVPFKAFDRARISTGDAPLFEAFVSMFLDEAAKSSDTAWIQYT